MSDTLAAPLPAWKRYNPIRLLLIGFLHTWRLLISPLYGQVCRFHPSCSAYALGCVERYGAAAGSYLAARRLLRCHPWNAGGYEPVPDQLDRWWRPSGSPDFADGDSRIGTVSADPTDRISIDTTHEAAEPAPARSLTRR